MDSRSFRHVVMMPVCFIPEYWSKVQLFPVRKYGLCPGNRKSPLAKVDLSGFPTNQDLSLDSWSSKLVPPQLPPLASRCVNRSESRFAVEPRLIKWSLAS